MSITALQQQIAIIMENRKGEEKIEIARPQISSRNKKKVMSFMYKEKYKKNLIEKLGQRI